MWRLWRWQLQKQFLYRSTKYLAIKLRLKYVHLYTFFKWETQVRILSRFYFMFTQKKVTEITSNSVLILCVLVIRKYHLSFFYTFPRLILVYAFLKYLVTLIFIGHNKFGDWNFHPWRQSLFTIWLVFSSLICPFAHSWCKYRIWGYYKENSSSILLIQCSNTIKQIKYVHRLLHCQRIKFR